MMFNNTHSFGLPLKPQETTYGNMTQSPFSNNQPVQTPFSQPRTHISHSLLAPPNHHIPDSKLFTVEEIKTFLDVDDDEYVEKFIDCNKLQKDNNKYIIHDKKKLIHPGKQILYILIQKDSAKSMNLVMELTNKYKDHQFSMDYIPTQYNGDKLVQLYKIIKMSYSSDIYDFVYYIEEPSKVPDCTKGIIDTLIDCKRLKKHSNSDR